jgi:hypothetical protein
MSGRKGIPRDAAYAELAAIAAETFGAGKKINRNKEQMGFITVLDEAQEVHAAFRAVAGLADCVQEDSGLPSVKGSDLAALLRVVNARLGRAIDVAYAASAGESGAVISIRD